MKTKRLNKLIEALKTESAKKMFDMKEWFVVPDGAREPRESFEAGGDCGTKACIGGMAAIIDPKFFNIDHFEHTDNRTGPFLYGFSSKKNNSSGTVVLCDWLGIDWGIINYITDPDSSTWADRKSDDIQHAINLLEAFRDGGEKALYQT